MASSGRADGSKLVVRGAREHNLRNVSLDLPRDRLIVFTGLSGSGKSSLAFDTIYAEGQRRYVESLSSYARQFLGQMDKPDVDFIEGLSPAISIDQKSASRNPRSTVGTITEIYDYLRLLYARVGVPHCPRDGTVVQRQTPQQIVDRILELPDGTRFQVLAPVVRGRKGEYQSLLEELAGQGFARARIDGEVHELSDPPKLARYEIHTIEVVVDRLVKREGIERRLTDSLETALRLAEGVAEVQLVARDDEPPLEDDTLTFSQHLACPACGLSFEELAPRNFSFNSPYGACPNCDGLGTRFEVDPELVVRDPELSIEEGAITPWAGGRGRVLRPGAGGPGDGQLVLGVHALEGSEEVRSEGRAVRIGQPQGSRPVPQPLRAGAQLRHPLRGGGAVAGPSPRRGRVGPLPRGHRGVHARGALPGLRGGPPQAREPGGDDRRAQHLRALRPGPAGRHPADDQPGAVRAGSSHRRPGAAGDPGPDAVPARCRPRLPEPQSFGGHPGRRGSAAHPPGLADRQRPGRRAVRTRRAVDRAAPAGQPQADRDPAATARSGQHRDRGRARRGHHPRGRPRGRHRTRRRGARRQHRGVRLGQRPPQVQGVHHRPVPDPQAPHPGALHAP